jgi:hypothetical protein
MKNCILLKPAVSSLQAFPAIITRHCIAIDFEPCVQIDICYLHRQDFNGQLQDAGYAQICAGCI